mgnify:CR=1 FL=1|jgi:NADH:flavin oxidoreductases, Old Yellow Enzyme family
MNKLLEPIRVGTLNLRNRIVVPPMETAHNYADGSVSQAMIDYYTERAIGGAGLIIVHNTAIDRKHGRSANNQPLLDKNHMIAGFSLLAESIQDHGAKAVLQLGHGGRQANLANIHGDYQVAPSAIASSAMGTVPKELTIEEIKWIQQAWADAAVRAQLAGFDGVEVHGAHGYLISSFFSRRSNKRKDEYGGSLENRARFAMEVIQKVRDAVGRNFTVGFRMNGDEFLEEGLEVSEAVAIARMLADTGNLDYISVSGATYESMHHMFPVMYDERGHLIHLAAAVKKAVPELPIIGVGSLDVKTGEQALREGKADLIAIGRGHIADPHIANKLAEGRPEDIRPCILCNEGCLYRIIKGRTVRCSVNPAVSREGTWKLTPAAQRKRVVVVGGGIAGMEAASAAAIRGHDVILLEKSGRLGGLLNEAAAPDFKQPLKDYLEWAKRQVAKHGVDVRMNTEATPDLVKELKPDALIIATGSEYAGLPLEGTFYTGQQALEDEVQFGEHVVIVGGGVVGCETALHVAGKHGKNVTILEMQSDIMIGFEPLHRRVLIEKMEAAGVKVLTSVKLKEAKASSVVYEDAEQKVNELPADTVIVCTGLKPRRDLVDELSGAAPQVFAIGDCAGGARIYDGVEAAWKAVLKI